MSEPISSPSGSSSPGGGSRSQRARTPIRTPPLTTSTSGGLTHPTVRTTSRRTSKNEPASGQTTHDRGRGGRRGSDTGLCRTLQQRVERWISVVGAYPRGQESYDLRTGEEGERPDVLENIRNVSLPESDPLFGCLGVNGQNPVRVVAKNPDEPGFVDTGLRLVPPRE